MPKVHGLVGVAVAVRGGERPAQPEAPWLLGVRDTMPMEPAERDCDARRALRGGGSRIGQGGEEAKACADGDR